MATAKPPTPADLERLESGIDGSLPASPFKLELLALIAAYRAQGERVAAFQNSERKASDEYLKIREVLGAWNTEWGGIDRFDVTLQAVRDLKAQRDAALAALRPFAEMGKVTRHDDHTNYFYEGVEVTGAHFIEAARVLEEGGQRQCPPVEGVTAEEMAWLDNDGEGRLEPCGTCGWGKGRIVTGCHEHGHDEEGHCVDPPCPACQPKGAPDGP